MKIQYETKIIGLFIILMLLISSCRKPDDGYDPEDEPNYGAVKTESNDSVTTLFRSFHEKSNQQLSIQLRIS